MRRWVWLLTAMVCGAARAAGADAVFFDNGDVWQRVRVYDADQTASGPSVLVQLPDAPPAPDVPRDWRLGVIHIEFGNPATSATRFLKAAHPPLVGIVKEMTDPNTVLLAGNRRVALLGVDPPVQNDPALYDAIKWHANRAVQGRKVWIEFDRRQMDDEGRLLGYVFVLPAGTFLNESLIAQGCGHASSRYPVREEYAKRFVAAELKASRSRLGLYNRDGFLKQIRAARLARTPEAAEPAGPSAAASVTTPPAGVKYSVLHLWKPFEENTPNGLGLHVLLESDAARDQIVALVRYLSADHDPVVIDVYSDAKAYDQTLEKIDSDVVKRHYLLTYTKNLTVPRGSYGANEIEWKQQTGKFAKLLGTKTQLGAARAVGKTPSPAARQASPFPKRNPEPTPPPSVKIVSTPRR